MTRKTTTRSKKAYAILILALLSCPFTGRAQVGILNGLTQEKVCKPGEAFQSFITIRNYGREPQDVRIYQTDYAFTFDGKSYYDPPGKAPRSNAGWIAIGHKQMTIAGASHADVRFSVKVPDDPGLVGTYWSVIMVEGVAKAQAAPPGTPQKEPSVGINQVVRYAVQIVTQIGDSGSLQLKFLKTELLQDNGRKTLHVDVENTGERWLRPVASLELYHQNGELAGKFEGERLRIFPETSVRFSFDVSRVAEGRYKALVMLDNKDSHVFGAQYTLDFTFPGKGPRDF